MLKGGKAFRCRFLCTFPEYLNIRVFHRLKIHVCTVVDIVNLDSHHKVVSEVVQIDVQRGNNHTLYKRYADGYAYVHKKDIRSAFPCQLVDDKSGHAHKHQRQHSGKYRDEGVEKNILFALRNVPNNAHHVFCRLEGAFKALIGAIFQFFNYLLKHYFTTASSSLYTS